MRARGTISLGIVLVVVGIVLVLRNSDLIADDVSIWPIILLAVGMGIITASRDSGRIDWVQIGVIGIKALGVSLAAPAVGAPAARPRAAAQSLPGLVQVVPATGDPRCRHPGAGAAPVAHREPGGGVPEAKHRWIPAMESL